MSNVLDKFVMNDRTVLITGAAGLLGRQFALALGQAGANVMLADLAGEAVRAYANQLKVQGIPAGVVEVDVTDPDSVQHMVTATLERFASLDALINSAALDPKFDPAHVDAQGANAFESYSLDAWRQALDVNLTGMFLASQAAVKPMLKKGGGVIVNICSTYGLNGPDQRIYERPDGSR
ncbi:MAG TPA: SDR family NAD(P)-dependent oxidoreductase, partial [Anaerolineaceae bacterium]|nr:SDR family NAD(P)-dependent oxidoreductase [Anaerolineaceae bacterium]